MEYVVDVQGFKRPLNEFVFKEVAVVTLEEDAQPSVYFFQPPYKWSRLPAKYKSENTWLQFNFHGMAWTSGDIPYEDVHETLLNVLGNARNIYVKGPEKKLEKIVPNVRNIEDVGCPSLQKLHTYNYAVCSNHTSCIDPWCAAQNTHALKKWLLERPARDEVDFRSTEGIAASTPLSSFLDD